MCAVKRGRPKLAREVRRNKSIQVMVTKDELNAVHNTSYLQDGIFVSAWVRELILNELDRRKGKK